MDDPPPASPPPDDDPPPLPTSPLGRASRAADFWLRASAIYAGFKRTQLVAAAALATGRSEDDVKRDVWDPHQERAGDAMFALASRLEGFYIKVGQFLSARPDICDPIVCKKLARLFDRVPPMPPATVRAQVEAAFGASLDTLFADFDIAKPLGAASVAQVHAATLRPDPGRRGGGGPRAVAVKVQRPGALALMREDLANVRLAAAFLSKTEVAFDLVAACDELSAQLAKEFDFVLEAATGDEVAATLDAAGLGGAVAVPRSVPGLITRTAFVMDRLAGTPLTTIAEKSASSRLPAAVAAAAASRLVTTLADAYGAQVFGPGRLFQADPHPGNVLVDPATGRIGLLDFGQAKRLTVEQQRGFARLVVALAAAEGAPLADVTKALTPAQQAEVAAALAALGVETELTPLGATCGRSELQLRVDTAFRMFDTRGRVNPFAPTSTLKMLRCTKLEKSLFFLLRTVQMLRGVAAAAGVEISVATRWRDRAEAVLAAATAGAGAAAPYARPRARVWAGGPVPGGVGAADGGWATVLAGSAAAVPRHPAAAVAWSVALGLSAAGAVVGAFAAVASAAAANHPYTLAGVAAALCAGAGAPHPLTAGFTVLAPWAAAVGLQASWPAMLLVARHPGAALAHGVAAGAALAAAALAAARAGAGASAAAMLPHGAGLAAGLAVNAVILRRAGRRPPRGGGVVVAAAVGAPSRPRRRAPPRLPSRGGMARSACLVRSL